MAQRFLVRAGSRVDLASHDPSSTSGAPDDREQAEALLAEEAERLSELQERLWAEARRSLLIVLQGVDTAGKDGTIRHVFHAFNPQGVTVTTFGPPTAEELAHDFLWRVHAHTPRAGHVAIFNRSHYEDVLAVRVHRTVPEHVWRARYGHINAFEHLLADAGTTVVKFLLHISASEQRRRLEERFEQPEKRWKLHVADLEEQPYYGEYEQAFSEMLERTSTAQSPWYIIPADHKWYRNWAVAHVLLDVLTDLDPKYPSSSPSSIPPNGSSLT